MVETAWWTRASAMVVMVSAEPSMPGYVVKHTLIRQGVVSWGGKWG